MASTAPRLDLIQSTAAALKTNPLTRQPAGRCTHIYAYTNIRTNQILYSLTPTLSPHRPLRQLPEAGNNTKPPKLRKDLWRPLWTLSLPPRFQGEAQGLEAWKRLNALRYLHEIYWTPSKEIGRVRSEQELEEIRERIEGRGGSKKESVYSYLKREKKKLRVKSVMDQKANSIADLAAVLVEQEALSLRETGTFAAKEVRRMMRLDQKAKKGAIERLEVTIEKLGTRIKELEKVMPGSKGNPEATNFRSQRQLRHRTRKALREAQEHKAELEHAVLMVGYGEPTEEALAEQELREQNQQLLREGRQSDPKLESQRLRALKELPAMKVIMAATRSPEQQDAHTLAAPERRAAAQQAREILIPVHDGKDSLSPEEAAQLRSYRTRTLEDTIQSHISKIAALKDQIKQTKTNQGPGEEVENFRTEQRNLNAQIKVWKAMVEAYELTDGTLELEIPEIGVLWHVGTFPQSFTTRDGEAVAEGEEPALELAGAVPEAVEEVDAEPIEASADTEQTQLESQEAEGEELEASEEPAPLTIPKPHFSMQGVKVSWQNILDAEFAPTWPATVQHEWMGMTRHSAPKPGAEPALDAAEYMRAKLRPRREREGSDKDVRKGVVDAVSKAVIRELMGKGKGKKKEGKGGEGMKAGLVAELEGEKEVVREI